MRLVESSIPGAVERDAALHLLVERAVLTRMVGIEVQNQGDPSKVSRRANAALGFLLGWIGDRYPSPKREPSAADGLSEMVVPDGCEPIMEIRAGAEVADAYAMLLTADNSLQVEGDAATLREVLARYWSRYPKACAAPWFLN